MRTIIIILAFTAAAAALAQQVNPPSRQLSDVQREELRKKADALRERNARERDEIQKGFRPPRAVDQPAQVNAALSKAQICKAMISAVMGREPKIINIDAESEGVIRLSYRRPSDGSHWSNRCKVTGQSVTWALREGRWRDHPLDEKITFERSGEMLIIRQRHADNSTSTNTYPISAL